MYRIYLPRRSHRPPGFTLIETMVVLAILGVLVSILIPAARGLSQSTATAHERSAARGIVGAWRTWSTDHAGALLPGQVESGEPLPGSESPLVWNGTPIPDIARRRWIWRLIPYLEDPGNIMWAGAQRQFWENAIANAADQAEGVYITTLHPSFGLNTDYLGGRHSASSDTWTLSEYVRSQDEGARPFYAESLSRLRQPAKLIAFASSRGVYHDNDAERIVEGFWRLTPPWKPAASGSAPRWSVTADGMFEHPEPGTPPETTGGFLSIRHGGQAIIASPDGHVSLQPFEALSDMQRWSDEASAPDWSPSLP
jgi:prepilin-type N-terminal cleavage/methylation domain-containing protein